MMTFEISNAIGRINLEVEGEGGRLSLASTKSVVEQIALIAVQTSIAAQTSASGEARIAWAAFQAAIEAEWTIRQELARSREEQIG